ncbi:MAG: hypothetical protein LKI88_02420 [Bifidobacterium sp.]|nr:hypothetical protein [Bifidobacterium sp.]MCI1864780.1 hypothetical protein [Bifidobacterium sp.]
MMAYDPHRRTPRTHRRIVRRGSEDFDAEGVKEEQGDRLTDGERSAQDDRRILGELPPHWGIFSERG